MPERILVVDDEKPIIELLKYSLKKEGFKVYSALRGEEALDLARRVNPDLIILDLMFPGLDGYEVLWLLKRNRQLSHIPVVVLIAKILKAGIKICLTSFGNLITQIFFGSNLGNLPVNRWLRSFLRERLLLEDVVKLFCPKMSNSLNIC